MNVPKNGDTVRFTGGTGRDDHDKEFEGIVNGDPVVYAREGITYIPVHVPGTNQNVMVELSHILSPVTPA